MEISCAKKLINPTYPVDCGYPGRISFCCAPTLTLPSVFPLIGCTQKGHLRKNTANKRRRREKPVPVSGFAVHKSGLKNKSKRK